MFRRSDLNTQDLLLLNTSSSSSPKNWAPWHSQNKSNLNLPRCDLNPGTYGCLQVWIWIAENTSQPTLNQLSTWGKFKSRKSMRRFTIYSLCACGLGCLMATLKLCNMVHWESMMSALKVIKNLLWRLQDRGLCCWRMTATLFLCHEVKHWQLLAQMQMHRT